MLILAMMVFRLEGICMGVRVYVYVNVEVMLDDLA
jgi:hypothetical protein